jgi:hypothetical protein
VVGQALSVAFAGAIFVGLGGAAAGAALAGGGSSNPAAYAGLQDTFMAAMRTAILVSGLLAAAGAVTSLLRREQFGPAGPIVVDPGPSVAAPINDTPRASAAVGSSQLVSARSRNAHA